MMLDIHDSFYTCTFIFLKLLRILNEAKQPVVALHWSNNIVSRENSSTRLNDRFKIEDLSGRSKWRTDLRLIVQSFVLELHRFITNCLNIKRFNIVRIETSVNDHVVAKITWLQTDTHTN